MAFSGSILPSEATVKHGSGLFPLGSDDLILAPLWERLGEAQDIAWVTSVSATPCQAAAHRLQWCGVFMIKTPHAHSLFATLALLTAFALIALGASPARAYQRCDDIANQLKDQIDSLKIGITAANTIYLSHPQARELSLGCSGRNFKNELYAKADGRKPKPAFLDLVSSAAAIIFSLTKDETLTGATRCINRMGMLRGDTVKMRYRRLDFECTRTKTEASIAISRGTDE
jgi:hypothetical protein